MSRKHAAEIVDGVVARVIVADPEWAAQRLGGTWLETDKTGESEVVYCGPGYGADPSFPERFAPPWVMPSPDSETGVWSSYPKGALAYHGGQLWRSTTDGNVWTPGISAWHPESEIAGVLPNWIQPTGAHDSYPEGFEVMRGGVHYVSDRAANNWEPGTFDSGWRVFGEEPEPGETWIDTNVTVTQLVAAGIYRVSGIPTLAFDQPIRLGDAETVFKGFWPTVGTPSDYIKISPHVAASVGAKVYKWS